MAIRQFIPSRAVEVMAPNYGSGYRIGGSLVLTAAHLIDRVGTNCTVRDKQSFGERVAQVVWRSWESDIALIKLPREIEGVEAITFGQLPKSTAGEKLVFQMYSYPSWAWTKRGQGSASGGRQVEGVIYLSDRSPDGLLVLEAERLPSGASTVHSEWIGTSGASIICDGLLIAVQSQHQNPMRPASLEASLLREVCEDERWQRLIEKHGINPELETVRLPTAEKCLEISWHEISLKLLESRLQLTTNPMTRNEGIDYSAEQVYVPLGLVERRKASRRKGGVLPEHGSKLYLEGQEAEVTQKFEYKQFLEQVLQQSQSPKSQGRRVALIGEPGSGKTTLLQQIARWVSIRFTTSVVIWVPLADLGRKTLKQYVYEQWLSLVAEHCGQAEVSVQTKNAFIAQCQQGRVWLLLDGLDEMLQTNNPLEEEGWLSWTRCILTCRLNLWASKPLAGFDVFRTLEFSYPQQVEQFVTQWFLLQGKFRIGQTLCAVLKKSGNERVQDLVRNPLRLTMLCFDWGLKDGNLPKNNAELYRRFVDRIYEWKGEEFPTTLEQQQALNRALGHLSLAAINDQDAEGEARFRLRHRFVKIFLEEALFELALQLGWLNQVGVDADDPAQAVYAFYHATFEEYFAALAIDDWDFFLPRKHRNRPVKNKTYRVFEPHWKQVLFLWLGREDGEPAQKIELKRQKLKEEFIKALATFKDGCSGFYTSRTFLLAAEGIAEFKDCAQADKIVDQLVQRQFCDISPTRRANKARRAMVNTDLSMTAFKGTDPRKEIQALVHLLKHIQDKDTQWRLIDRLCEIGSNDKTAIQALVRLLESTQDEDTQLRVAESLGEIDPDNKIAVQALVRLLESTRYSYMQLRVAESLGEIDPGNKIAIQALVRLLESTQDEDTQLKVAESLGKIDPGNKIAVQALVHLLESTQDEDTQLKVAESLGKIDPGNKIAVQALVHLLESTRYSYMQWRVAESLGKIDPDNKIAVQALVRLLESTQDENTQLRVAESLGKIDPGNKIAIQALVRLLESTQDEDTQLKVAESLGKIDPGNKIAVQALVHLLESTQDEDTQLKVAESLGKIDPGNKIAVQALVHLLESTQDEDTQLRVAESLGKIDPDNKIAIQALVRLLESTQDEDTQLRVAESLGEIDPDNKIAIQALVHLLESTQDEDVRWGALCALDRIGTGNKVVKREVVRFLRDPFRSLGAYMIMMDCAQTLSYQEFYQVFRTRRRILEHVLLCLLAPIALPYYLFHET